MGILPPAMAGAPEGSPPVGGITSAVDDPDIWGDDGPSGGLYVSGWTTDAEQGGGDVQVRVSSGDVVRSFSSWSDWPEWGIELPLAAGEHTVCATAVDVPSGDDVDLGCVTATVPAYSPGPSTQSFTTEAVAGQDGSLQVLRTDRPVLHARACLDPTTTTADTTDLGLVIELDAFDGAPRVSEVLRPVPVDEDGLRCLEGTWQVDEPLLPGAGYWPFARLVLGDLAPSASDGGDLGVLYLPLGTTAASPADGEVLVDPGAVLSVQVETASLPVDVEFEVASAGSGSVVADGRSAADDDGVATWTVPVPLDPGPYTWRTRVTDQYGQSDWSPASGFVRDVVHAPRPTSVTLVDGSGEVRDGLEIASDAQPGLGASVCLDAAGWTGSLTDLSMRLRVVGDDGHQVESGELVPAVEEQDDGSSCLRADWRVSELLHPDIRYAVAAQTTGAAGGPSAWVEGDSFLAPETAEDRLAGDLADGTLSREGYARYLLYRWFEPELVPTRYQVPPGFGATELNTVLVEVIAMLDGLDPEVAEELTDYFTTQLGGEERAPLTVEEDQAAGDQFWADAQDLHLDPREGTGPTPEPGETPDPAPSGDPGAAARPGSAGARGVPTEPNTPDTFRWCSDEGRRTVPELLTRSSDASLTCHLSTPKAVFHYTTSDVDATHGVPPDDDVDMFLLDAASGGGPDGVPDEINAVAAAYYEAADTYADLGFDPIAVTDVLVADIPAALSVPEFRLVYVGKDRAGEGPGRSVYLTRHELFHQYQYEYADVRQIAADMGSAGLGGTTTTWWLEATAEWATHQAETSADGNLAGSTWFAGSETRYAALLPDHLDHPSDALTRFIPGVAKARQPQYGSFLFAEYLEQLFGPQIIAETWRALADEPVRAIDAIAAVLADDYGTELSTVVTAYHRANYTIDTPEFVGDARYTDPHRQGWAGRLTSPHGRPPSRSLTLEPDQVLRRSGTVEAGGASYVDLDVPTNAPEGVTFTVQVEATSGSRYDLSAQIVYFDSYPWLCHPMDDRGLDSTPGRAEQTVTLSPSCPTATLIISHADAQGTTPGIGRGEISFTYRIVSEAPSADTVVEHRGSGAQHHRINFGDDLRRPLFAADSTATLNIDVGTAISDGREVDSLHVFSWDGTVRATDTVVINGVPVELAVHRDPSTVDGRIHLLWGSRWRAEAVTYYVIPDGVLHDGVNTIDLPVKGYLQIYGAYLSTRAPLDPNPDPNPDPDPGPGPVASRSVTP